MSDNNEDEYYKGVKIQKLPLIGEPLNIKTVKQGRIGTLRENMVDPLTMVKDGHGGVKKKERKRRYWKKKLC